ncbi:hypothetical protein [Jeotgalibacillus proteolyticus]|uniref:hypothetical protein n=1 Tax=Jeotgalibacillus proteolyticus TaxID=2082395 RepID=UPI003CED6645
MSLTSILNSNKKRDKEFKNILLSLEPPKEKYYTLSGKSPFSDEYSILVSNELSNPYDSSLVGTAFDYLSRFRVGQFLKREDVHRGLVALSGYKKLSTRPEFLERKLEHYQPYFSWFNQLGEFVKDASSPISSIYEIAVHLAKLEQLKRRRIMKEEVIDIDYVLFEGAPSEVIYELDKLMKVFEEKFMIPEIINKNSHVIFNPVFGVGSALVSGADADIFIDGTLYDFKTSQDKSLKKNDNLQLIGYYLLNELAKKTMSDELDFDYTYMNIEKVSFYKARYGELEYYDTHQCSPPTSKEIRRGLKTVAEHFKTNKGALHTCIMADIDYAEKLLEELRIMEV